QFGPTLFVVSFDRWLFFRERPLESDHTVHMTVRAMVYHLPDCPSIGTIGCVKLFIAQMLNFFPYLVRKSFNDFNKFISLLRRRKFGWLHIAPNGIFEFFQ